MGDREIAPGRRLPVLPDAVARVVDDRQTLNDGSQPMAPMRPGIVTPVSIPMILAVYRIRGTALRETMGVGGAVLGVSLAMIVMVSGDSPKRWGYQLGTLPVTIFQRMRFRYGAVALCPTPSKQFVTIDAAGIFTSEAYAADVVFFVTGVAPLQLAAYRLERSDRRTYLFVLCEHLLHDRPMRLARVDAPTGPFDRRHMAQTAETLWAGAAAAPRVGFKALIEAERAGRNCVRTAVNGSCRVGARPRRRPGV